MAFSSISVCRRSGSFRTETPSVVTPAKAGWDRSFLPVDCQEFLGSLRDGYAGGAFGQPLCFRGFSHNWKFGTFYVRVDVFDRSRECTFRAWHTNSLT